MNVIGVSNSTNKQLVKFTISLFTDKNYELIHLNEFDNSIPESITALSEKINDSRFLIISLTNNSYNSSLNSIDNWFKKLPNPELFNNTSILLISTSNKENGDDEVLKSAKEQFLKYGSEIIDTFYLPNFETNFDDENGITDIKLSLELIRKANVIKQQSKLKHYFKKRISTCGIDNTGFENCDSSSY